MENVRALVQRRSAIKGRITRFRTFLENYRTNPDLVQLRERLLKIRESWNVFEDVQAQLEETEATAADTAERVAFEDAYFELVSRAERYIGAATTANEQTTQNNTGVNTNGVIKLPTINLPEFDGKYDEWLCFYDNFKAIIHDNRDVKPVQKLQYLRSCLSGDAAQIIESLSTSADNYEIAWALIKERYDNKRIIIQNHVRLLFELPNMTRESPVCLRVLIDNSLKHMRALKGLGLQTDQWDAMLIHLITSKLDRNTHREWERSVDGTVLPAMDELWKFLRNRCHVLENIGAANVSQLKNNERVTSTREARNSVNKRNCLTVQQGHCPVCKKSHSIQHCEEFSRSSHATKISIVKAARLCFNCLRPNHSVSVCKSRPCAKCGRRHSDLLHPPEAQSPSRVSAPLEDRDMRATKSLQTVASSQVLLSTAIIKIFDKIGKPHRCKVLLDSGSQSNFMTTSLAERLELIKREVNVPVSGFGQTLTHLKYLVNAEVQSSDGRFGSSLAFLAIEEITEYLPARYIDRGGFDIPRNIELADPEFCKPSRIDALIGAEIFYDLLCVGQIKLAEGTVILQKTKLGWIVGGRINEYKRERSSIVCNVSVDKISLQMAKFWELEQIPDMKHLSDEEKACERHFEVFTSRDRRGRYCVRLPFNDNVNKLGESYRLAERRLYAIERRLSLSDTHRVEYSRFLREYMELGHMTEVTNTADAKKGYFMPHHAVIKSESLTTKLRVVFDASAKTTTGISLNDALMTGPTLQDDVFSIITRFRSHACALTADLEKMFRQIRMHFEDTKYQKILWREGPMEAVKIYSLQTVTYGTAPGTFLATRCLQQLAIDEEHAFPLASKILKRDFYVDDLLTGADSYEEARQLRDELIRLVQRGGFCLRQWASNDTRLINDLGEQSNVEHFCLDGRDTVKTLGIHWKAREDAIVYVINSNTDNSQRITKRALLSRIAAIFDPLGLLGPIIVKAKIMMQRLWELNLKWDETVPMDIFTEWNDYRTQLKEIGSFSIPRKMMLDVHSGLQLHGFSDASEKAYGACIYLRSTNKRDCMVGLVCAKSRVAPLKRISLPKLELCAALLLANLYAAVIKALNRKFDGVWFWSDSTITLHWINSSPHKLKTFVANRVAQIQEVTENTAWRHVPSEHNPADALSRGQLPAEFSHNKLWCNGPDWLRKSEDGWPSNVLERIEIPEQRSVINLRAIIAFDLIERFSSLTTLKRVVAYCLRFAHNTRNKEKRSGFVTTIELQRAMNIVIRIIQKNAFGGELRDFSEGRALRPKSKLLSLNPFLDNEGIIRVGGRLEHAKLGYSQRHPILLPSDSCVTKMIFQDAHVRNCHCGVQATLYAVRQSYWPLRGKNIARHIVRTCVKCFRCTPRTPQYIMGNLPRDRLVSERPFENVGVDYCGPFFVKERRYRNRGKVKIFVAVYICLTTKAVHLEVVSELTTEAFIASLRRFFARRGIARVIYSDNATNFAGANNELRQLYDLLHANQHQVAVDRFCTNQGIEWKFIPPRSPHFGGLWEAAVKGFKHHMRRTLGETLFTFEEFNTFVIEIEAVLNSRPLTALSADPNDYLALTPAHFLIGSALRDLPQSELTDVPAGRLSAWQHIQKIKQNFWRRWNKEYINELQQRTKWLKSDTDAEVEPIKIGKLVIVKNGNAPPLQWQMGRIVAVHPGSDNIIRVVTVKTKNGIYKRNVTGLALLPIE